MINIRNLSSIRDSKVRRAKKHHGFGDRGENAEFRLGGRNRGQTGWTPVNYRQ